jgi:hypothetical protein
MQASLLKGALVGLPVAMFIGVPAAIVAAVGTVMIVRKKKKTQASGGW